MRYNSDTPTNEEMTQLKAPATSELYAHDQQNGRVKLNAKSIQIASQEHKTGWAPTGQTYTATVHEKLPEPKIPNTCVKQVMN